MAELPPVYGRGRVRSRKGGSATLRDHSGAYRRLRLRVLAEQPLCTYCLQQKPPAITAAAIVDHIIALALGGSNERDNLTSACQPCNDAKAKLERRYLARGYEFADIMRDPDLARWIGQGRWYVPA